MEKKEIDMENKVKVKNETLKPMKMAVFRNRKPV